MYLYFLYVYSYMMYLEDQQLEPDRGSSVFLRPHRLMVLLPQALPGPRRECKAEGGCSCTLGGRVGEPARSARAAKLAAPCCEIHCPCPSYTPLLVGGWQRQGVAAVTFLQLHKQTPPSPVFFCVNNARSKSGAGLSWLIPSPSAGRRGGGTAGTRGGVTTGL